MPPTQRDIEEAGLDYESLREAIEWRLNVKRLLITLGILSLLAYGCESSVSPSTRYGSMLASGSERESEAYVQVIASLAASDNLIVDHHIVTCTFLLGGPCTCPARADSTKAAIKNKLPIMYPGFGFPMGWPNGWQY